MLQQLSLDDLQAGLGEMDASPKDSGTIDMIVARPDIGERKAIEQGEISTDVGLVGDNWKARGSRHTDDGSALPEAQITLMNSRIIDLIAQDRNRWELAGDQFFVDIDLSIENLPAGQQIKVGTAILEISEKPHTGCAKFTERFGSGAIRLVNSREGRAMRLRGVNARVIKGGVVNVGDTVSKVDAE